MEENIPTSAGLSSFNLLNEKRFFDSISLKPGMHVLDLGCGLGNYAIAAAPIIGSNGVIYALDPWDEGIETLELRAGMGGHTNIRTGCWRTGSPLPVADHSIDLCLMATVTHILVREEQLERALAEVKRVLKPGGLVAVVEFYKKDEQPGPPLEWRLHPEELAALFNSHGYREKNTIEVGPHNYLSLFKN